MKTILIILLLLLCGCRTVNKSTEAKDTSKYEKINSITDTSAVEQLTTNVFTQTFTAEEYASILSSLNVNYDGSLADKFKLSIQPTEFGGIDIELAGKGTADYSQNFSKDVYQLTELLQQQVDSLKKITATQIIKYDALCREISSLKNKAVKQTGLPFGGYLTIVIIVVVLIILAWIAWRFRLFRQN